MRSLLISELVLVCSAVLSSQSGLSIQAPAEDSSGAVIPFAKVTMTNPRTGISRTADTNAAGLYNFPLIQVGDYV